MTKLSERTQLVSNMGVNMFDIEKAFTYHPPKDDQPARYISLREKAKELAMMIDSLCPESRERSLAFTKLDEVVMFANASIARNE